MELRIGASWRGASTSCRDVCLQSGQGQGSLRLDGHSSRRSARAGAPASRVAREQCNARSSIHGARQPLLCRKDDSSLKSHSSSSMFCSPSFLQDTQKTPPLRALAVACPPGSVARSWTELHEAEPIRAGKSDQTNEKSTEDILLTCTTFNVLAPIYKRLGNESIRESSFREEWYPRNRKILSTLLAKKSSIICLQELWLANPELVAMYEDGLNREGYTVLKLPRPNNRGDGLLTAVKADKLEVLHHEDLLFNDGGDKVAQFVWLRSKVANADEEGLEMLVVNTHLLFPHDSTSSFIRLRQVYKVLEHLESYKAERGLGPIPIVLCGDLNGTKQGQVSRFLRSQGFVSSYDMAHNHPDTDERWVSHKNHHGVVCGVDFIWLLNTREQRSPLSADWKAAVFKFLQRKLREIGCTDERQAFNFFCSASDEDDEDWDDEESEEDKERAFAGPLRPQWGDGADCIGHFDLEAGKNVITIDDLQSAVSQIGHEMGLTTSEVKELMGKADKDGNGVVDYADFQAVVNEILNAPGSGNERMRERNGESLSQRLDANSGEAGTSDRPCQHKALAFEVKGATLFPPETERGVWPKDWGLSDHSMLTAVFSATETCVDDNELCSL